MTRVEILTLLLGALTLAVIAFQTYIYLQQRNLMRDMHGVSESQAQTLKDQVGVMERQQDLMGQSLQATERQGKLIEQSVEAAITSARAAEQSAQIASQSFAIGERPYLFVEETKLERLAAGIPLSAKIRIRNGGRTPAFNFWADATFAAARAEQPDLAYEESANEPVTLFLAAGAEVTLASEALFTLSYGQVAGIHEGRISLYVFGRGGYEDGAGKAYPFDYCLVYSPKLNYLAACSDSVKPQEKTNGDNPN